MLGVHKIPFPELTPNALMLWGLDSGPALTQSKPGLQLGVFQ